MHARESHLVLRYRPVNRIKRTCPQRTLNSTFHLPSTFAFPVGGQPLSLLDVTADLTSTIQGSLLREF